MAWRQEERNLARVLIKQGPMAKRTKVDTRDLKKGKSTGLLVQA
jgi:hypothetical protein